MSLRTYTRPCDRCSMPCLDTSSPFLCSGCLNDWIAYSKAGGPRIRLTDWIAQHRVPIGMTRYTDSGGGAHDDHVRHL